MKISVLLGLVFLVPALASASCEEAYQSAIGFYEAEDLALSISSTAAFATGHPILSSSTSTTDASVGFYIDQLEAALAVIEEAKNGDGIELREFHRQYGLIVNLTLDETKAAVLEANQKNIFCTPDPMSVSTMGLTVQLLYGKSEVP